MAKLQSFGTLLFVYLTSLFWTCLVIFEVLWKLVKIGPRKVFYVKRRDIRPDVIDDPSLGTHGFARLKTLKLHYVAAGPEDKPLMLFVHGFPEFWYSWRHQMKEFSTDYRCVAIDMRGFGESDKPKGVSSYVMEKLTGDLKELIPALGYEKCILVAHDWGGAVAWDFAWRNPEMVERLITCNIPNGKAFQKHLEKSRSQFLKSWYVFLFQMPCFPEFYLRQNDLDFLTAAFTKKPMGMKEGSLTADEIEAFKYVFAGDLTGPINYYRAALRYKPVPPPSENVKMPVLIVWGTNDGGLEKEMADLSKNDCDDCTVKYIEGCSHWVQQEEPEQTNTFIREFLAAKAGR